MQYDRSIRQTIDWRLVICWLLLVMVGWVSIFASVHSSEPSSIFDASSRSGKQFIWIVLAFVVSFAIIAAKKPRTWEALATPAYLGVVTLLVAVLFLGADIKGSRSWFVLGPISFQPAEISKITTSLLLAQVLSRQNFKMTRWRDFIVAAAVILLPTAVILLESETGTVLVYMGFVFVFYLRGLSGWWLALIALAILLFILTLVCPVWVAFAVLVAALAAFYISARLSGFKSYVEKGQLRLLTVIVSLAGAALIFSTNLVFEHVLKAHQRLRIEVLLGLKDDPAGVGYNVKQSMIAIGSGGFWGKGFLQGTQTAYGFVPEQSTDFIFCTIGEEAGFVGCAAVILLFCYLIYRLMSDAESCRDQFTRIYGYCVAACIFMHLIINIGMTVGLMPVIGIPLPFISYGGSSLLAFSVLLAIFVALYKEEKKYF